MVLFAVTVSLLIYDINALRSENILCNFNALKLAQTEGPTTHWVVGFPCALEGKGESAGVRVRCRCLLGQAWEPGLFCDCFCLLVPAITGALGYNLLGLWFVCFSLSFCLTLLTIPSGKYVIKYTQV